MLLYYNIFPKVYKPESFLTFFQLAFWKQSVHLNKYKETLTTSFIWYLFQKPLVRLLQQDSPRCWLGVCSNASVLPCFHFSRLCGDCVSLETSRPVFAGQGQTEYNPLNCKSSFCPGHHVRLTYAIHFASFQIWVHSAHNASGYFTIYGDESLQSDHINSRLSFGDTQTVWARTGYLGFLRRTELTDANGGENSQ